MAEISKLESDRIIKWLWLKLTAKISALKGGMLYEALGSIDAIYNAGRSELDELGFLKKDEVDRLCVKSTDGIEEYMRTLEAEEVRVMSIDMSDYPEALRLSLRPPYLLFVKGRQINLNDYLCIAIVGTRNPTVYGQRVTESLASGIAGNGAIIVSGMALGVDAIAHWAALKAGMPTVAVLGCGVDVVIPKSNDDLYEEIVRNGMVISEYPLSVPPSNYTFPERNRIIAGISQGLAVTEADIGSGSLITADYALKNNRDVFAVPGNIDSDTSRGTNRLIKQGAFSITEPADVTESFYTSHFRQIKNTLNDFVLDAGSSVEERPSTEVELIIPENASNEDKILISISKKPLTIDQISYLTGISLAELDVSLLMMEVGGKIKKTQGIYYTIV